MKNFKELFETLRIVSDKYAINTSDIDNAINELTDFRVTVPLVGNFSTGKSSLINAAMNDKILSENITPETSVATEITYGNNTVILTDYSNNEKIISLDEFNKEVLSASEYKLVHIETTNEFINSISSLKLVDMPGFDSGNDVHNRAIDNYMPNSLAYILAIAADEGTLKESIVAFLNELRLYDVPVYTVITKSEKVDADELEKIKEHIFDIMKRFMKKENIKVAVTNAKGRNKNISEFKEILFELHHHSDEIEVQHFSLILKNICDTVEMYLLECIDKSDMTLEQLKYEEEQHEEKIHKIECKFDIEKQKFSKQIDKCIEIIKSKISSELYSCCSSLESMILSGSDISEKINFVVRNAIASGIQSELEPQVKKYMKNISNLVSLSSFGDLNVDISDARKRRYNELANEITAAAGPAITAVATAIGTAVSPGIGTIVGAAIGAVVTFFAGSIIEKKQQEERRRIASEKVNEIIASVIAEAGSGVEASIRSYTDQINEHIESDINKEREIEEKALNDTKEKLAFGSMQREQKLSELRSDLNIVRGLKNEL